jgi:nitrogen fixation protein FixH
MAGGLVRGWHVLAALLGFFVLVLGVNGAMIYAAITTFGGIDNPNAYREGLAYNARIAAGVEQAQTGWRDQVEILAGSSAFRVSLSDKDGRPVGGLAMRATIVRPATNRFDAVLPMQEKSPGAYEAALSALESGSWIVNVEASRPGGGEAILYQTRRRLWLKP